jgi:hypothetical protein
MLRSESAIASFLDGSLQFFYADPAIHPRDKKTAQHW